MHKRTVFEILNKASIQYANKPYLSQKDDNGWVRTTFSEAKIKSLIYSNQWLISNSYFLMINCNVSLFPKSILVITVTNV